MAIRRHDICAVILAAGLGSRLGQPKAKLAWPGYQNLLDRAVKCAVPWADGILAVIPRNMKAPPKTQVRVVRNHDPYRGMASSLKVAVDALMAHYEVNTVAFMLVDQPFVQADDGSFLVQCWKQRDPGVRILRPLYDGVPGHPLLIEWSLAVELVARIEGDVGLSRVLNDRLDLATVSRRIDGRPNPNFDVDSWSDYLLAMDWLKR